VPHPVQDVRAVLEHNVGFDDSARWDEYARRNEFVPVKAAVVRQCPDCSGPPLERTWGQFVHYSTLIRLLECSGCGLIWADAQIDPETIRTHFEVAYKDEQYFRVSRRHIYEHLAGVIDKLSPAGARVLDIGGARGDLMAELVDRRPDISVVVNDISESATRSAAGERGFATLTGGAVELAEHRGQYDVVVLSDVMYYESKLNVLWGALSHLVAPGGSIVIRIPNKHYLIAIGQLTYRLTHTAAQRAMQDRVRFFNPEHVFLFRRRYLRRRLLALGFALFQALPSPLLGGTKGAAPRSAFFSFASRVHRMRQSLILTPSMVVVGRRQESSAKNG
jgi:2-polyprenyl-3-methyl-5-hydroxy-6-metoxy-1,4-benzoquinol methylase